MDKYQPGRSHFSAQVPAMSGSSSFTSASPGEFPVDLPNLPRPAHRRWTETWSNLVRPMQLKGGNELRSGTPGHQRRSTEPWPVAEQWNMASHCALSVHMDLC